MAALSTTAAKEAVSIIELLEEDDEFEVFPPSSISEEK